MRHLLILALLLPTAASAGGGGQSTEEVTFKVYKKFFRGDQVSKKFPEDSAASLELKADLDTELWLETTGISRLAWPEDELIHGWATNRRDGHAKLDTDLELEAVIHVDIAGIAFNYKLWTRNYSWTKTQPIEGLLLPGSDQESVVITITDYLKDVLSYTYDDVAGYPVDLVLAGDIEPTTSALITGTSIRSNKVVFTHIEDTGAIKEPDVNNGWVDMESEWTGEIEANFNAQVWATINICEDITFWGYCYEIPIEAYNWILPPDILTARSDEEEYTLDIPAADTDASLLDLGNVELGSSAKAQLNLKALSSARVSGDAWLDDEAGVYTLVAGASLDVPGNNQAPLVVEFAPTELGEFTTTLTIETNDLTRPTIEIAVRGTGIEPAPDIEPTDSGDPTEDTGGGLGLALIALLGVRRRRS